MKSKSQHDKSFQLIRNPHLHIPGSNGKWGMVGIYIIFTYIYIYAHTHTYHLKRNIYHLTIKYTIHPMRAPRAMLGKSFSLNLFGCHAQQRLFSDPFFFHAVAMRMVRLKGTNVIPGSLVVYLFGGFFPSIFWYCQGTPLKINMEHNHGGLEDHFPF